MGGTKGCARTGFSRRDLFDSGSFQSDVGIAPVLSITLSRELDVVDSLGQRMLCECHFLRSFHICALNDKKKECLRELNCHCDSIFGALNVSQRRAKGERSWKLERAARSRHMQCADKATVTTRATRAGPACPSTALDYGAARRLCPLAANIQHRLVSTSEAGAFPFSARAF